jgi:membrane protein DedA with SNARE-associated domain
MISIVAYLSEIIVEMIESFGYFGIFVAMALESACIPFPSEIIMPFAGFVVSEGKMSLLMITLAGAFGNLAGSLIAYFFGLKGGRPLLERYGVYFFISKRKLKMADEWFMKYGEYAVFFSRLLPVVRTYISLPAGVAGMDLKKFVIYSFAGSLPWCLALGYLGVLLGPRWDSLSAYFHILDAIIILSLVAVVVYLLARRRR